MPTNHRLIPVEASHHYWLFEVMLVTVWTWKEKHVSFWNNSPIITTICHTHSGRDLLTPPPLPPPSWLVNWTTSFLSHISITLKRLTHTSCHTQHNPGSYSHHFCYTYWYITLSFITKQQLTHIISVMYHAATPDPHQFCHTHQTQLTPPSVTPQWWLAHIISATRITQGLMDITLPVCHTYRIDTTDPHHCHTGTPDPHHSVCHTYHTDTTDPHHCQCHTAVADPHHSATQITQTQLTNIVMSDIHHAKGVAQT